MDIKDIVAKASNGHAFIDPDNSGAKDLDAFQRIVELARMAETQGLLETVFVHPMRESGQYDLLYITGATESGRAFLSEP